jgi:phosphoribosylamine--glycine ligase
MDVLVVGSGGREHALVWALAASPLVSRLYCAPGNGGIADDAICVPIAATDIDGIVRFCRDKNIGFVVVGPEQPLTDGLVDRLEAAGIPAFGPSAAAAQLESSKAFTKDLCVRHGIPTARHAAFTDAAAAKHYAAAQPLPVVVKADGLAAGKGVVIAETHAEAVEAIDAMMSGRFGTAGERLVIEEFLTGEEASVFALTDGRAILPLAGAQDHKRVGEGDTGPNTGGMGAYSPAPVVTEALLSEVCARILRPTVDALAAAGTPYKGVLYAGIMVTARGPFLLEYNVRFGDPECQVLMPRLKSDLLPALMATRDGVLDSLDLRWHDDSALTVVMAARGYPGAYDTGSVIRNRDAAAAVEGVTIFHAGTERRDGEIHAAGGRVLNVTARGRDLAEARARAYRAVDLIDWPQGFCRRDIAWRAECPRQGVA